MKWNLKVLFEKTWRPQISASTSGNKPTQHLASVPLQNNNKTAAMQRHVNFILNQPFSVRVRWKGRLKNNACIYQVNAGNFKGRLVKCKILVAKTGNSWPGNVCRVDTKKNQRFFFLWHLYTQVASLWPDVSFCSWPTNNLAHTEVSECVRNNSITPTLSSSFSFILRKLETV
jgi:hypothetical protein